MAWLIKSPSKGKTLLFDLGIAKDISCLPPVLKYVTENIMKCDVEIDVFDSLAAREIPLSEICCVIISHLHFDHIGDRYKFPNSTQFIVGPTSLELLDDPDVFPQNPKSFYSKDLVPRDRTTELPHTSDSEFWKPLGPFEHAHDFFSDGSLYIINAPGHSKGHINLLVRTSDGWVCLAGDSCHSPAILSGEKAIAVYHDDQNPEKMTCMHSIKEVAERHIQRLRDAQKLGVKVVLAHDWEYEDTP